MGSLPDSGADIDVVTFDDPAEVAGRAASRLKGRHALVLTDYDGTLSQLVDKPSDATVTDEVRRAFNSLASMASYVACSSSAGDRSPRRKASTNEHESPNQGVSLMGADATSL